MPETVPLALPGPWAAEAAADPVSHAARQQAALPACGQQQCGSLSSSTPFCSLQKPSPKKLQHDSPTYLQPPEEQEEENGSKSGSGDKISVVVQGTGMKLPEATFISMQV